MHHRFILIGTILSAVAGSAFAAGTRAGTAIATQVAVDYEIAAEPRSGVSNVVTVIVAEVIDVNVLVQTPERLVGPGVAGQPLNFTITNVGNGSEAFELTALATLSGDDFDPSPASPSIIFDSDGDGVLSTADVHYVQGVNEPVLEPDAGIGVFLVNDIPGELTDGLLGFAELRVDAVTATGVGGDIHTAAGDGGVDAVLGPSGGADSGRAQYLVGVIGLSLSKVARVAAPQGDDRAVPGAAVTYSVRVVAEGTGSALGAVFRDAIPLHTRFIAGSLRLNGQPLTDTADVDAGEYVAAPPEVIVRLGDLSPSDPAQIVEFTVSIE